MTNAANNECAIPCLRELQERFNHLRADLTSQFATSTTRKKAPQRALAAAKHKVAKNAVAASTHVEQKHAAVERKPSSMFPNSTLATSAKPGLRASTCTCTAPILHRFLCRQQAKVKVSSTGEQGLE